MLVVDGVSKSFGGVHALREVSIELRAGEILGLLGPNGAGKSTLIDVIAGAYTCDGGSVKLLDHELAGRPAWYRARQGIGRTFQRIRLVPTLTVFDNVGIPRHGKSIDRAAVERALDAVGVAEWAHRRPGDLPAGIERLVEVARVLVAEPKVVLLDEPLAGLGEEEAAHFATVLERLRNPQRSILLVDHNAPFVLAAADRVSLMVTGQKVLEGSPADVAASDVARSAYLGQVA